MKLTFFNCFAEKLIRYFSVLTGSFNRFPYFSFSKYYLSNSQNLQLTMAYQKITAEQYLEQMQNYSKWNANLLTEAQDLVAYVQGDVSTAPTPSTNFNWYLASAVNMLNPPNQWTEADRRLFGYFATNDPNWKQGKSGADYYYGGKLLDWTFTIVRDYPHTDNFAIIVRELQKNGLTDEIILDDSLIKLANVLVDTTNTPTAVGKFVLSFLPDKGKHIVKHGMSGTPGSLLSFLLRYHESTVEENIETFIDPNAYNVYFIGLLLAHNTQKYEPIIVKAIEQKKPGAIALYDTYELLIQHLPEKYASQRKAMAYQYLIDQKKEANPNPKPSGYWYYHESYKRIEPANPGESWKYIYYSIYLLEFLLEEDRENAIAAAVEYMKDNNQVKSGFLTLLDKHLQAQSVDILIHGIEADPSQVESDYFRTLLGILSKYDYQRHEDKIWALTQHKSKRLREIVSVTLSKLGERVIPKAEQLLSSKKGDVRQAGALILSLIGTDTAKQILNNALNAEKNDDARDVMLQALGDSLFVNANENTVADLVAATQKRGKLDKPVEIWIEESQLPKLYYVSGNVVSTETVRFLFYRMARSKDIRPDMEAKPLLQLIDRNRSGDFAKKLYELFIQKGSDSKHKFLLALAGLLGNDDSVDKMKAQVNQLADASRGKMAEYTVQALALIGTNKALRAVEFLSRKYKSKNKNIGAAALEAFKLAAEELNISLYELADSIIPTFDFEGLFRNFTVKDQEYRAFIDTDFKLTYFDEDNKKLKSTPKGTSKELQDEFKEIGKEVRDIVKSQSGRMEQYLVIQRKWSVEAWQEFFLNNPIMFVYAVRLLWGVYDKNGTLLSPFMVMEDTSLINLEDEEISLDEDQVIGMVHPLSLSEEENTTWKTKMFDYGLESIFPQLDRPIVRIEDKNRSLKISHEYDQKKISSYGFGGQMEKLGWARGSVVDGGYVTGYYKTFPEASIEVLVETEGIFVGGYYEDAASLTRLYFTQKGSVQMGSYVYDEPSNESDSRLIAFGDVPAIIYSEVTSDLTKVIIPEEKKQEELQEA